MYTFAMPMVRSRGFLYSWTCFLIAKPASIATITTGLVRILGTFPVFSFFSRPFFSEQFLHFHDHLRTVVCDSGDGPDFRAQLYRSSSRAGEFQFLFTLLKVAIILGIVA